MDNQNVGSSESTSEIPFRITFRDFEPTDSVRFAVQSHIERLEQLNARIISCDIVVSLPHKHLHKKSVYHVDIRMHVPGEDIIITREPEKESTHHDVFVAISDAFDALERRLESYLDKRRGFVKSH